MSYEDLEEARAKRAAKEAETSKGAAGSGNVLRGRERWLGRLKRREGASWRLQKMRS
jgi:hypothetical protein